MVRYNSCDINNMSFREIIEELFSFKKISPNRNPFDIERLLLCDFDEEACNDKECMITEFHVSYSIGDCVNTIVLSSPETGEIVAMIEQKPTMCPDIERRWSYEITYCSWDFNPSVTIKCGFGVMMGEA